MSDNTVIMIFNHIQNNTSYDIEVPLDITANELIYGLNQGLHLHMNLEDVEKNYLCTEAPTALLRGNVTLEEFGLRNGTTIQYDRS